MIKYFSGFLFLTLSPAVIAGDAELAALVEWMSGSFSSAEQAADNEAYYHITLEMAPIWQEREGEHWLYVEQAAAATRNEPYRQRIYRVSRSASGEYASAVYLLPDPAAAVGAWQDGSLLSGLEPADLELREGCTVYLQRIADDRFQGSTREDACSSSLRGASYATSEVTVTPNGIESWDRGFDHEGEQVWGAEQGAYIFKRE